MDPEAKPVDNHWSESSFAQIILVPNTLEYQKLFNSCGVFRMYGIPDSVMSND